jgi:autotransporter family porin
VTSRLARILCCGLVLAIAAPATAAAVSTKPVGWGPLSSKKAAKKVKRSDWEPRPQNGAANHRVPKRKLLEAWRARSEMPYAKFVNGRFRGTTDEIIQWAARKWGLDPELLRAVAVVESWWRMETVGDNGDSFGLYQVRRPYHCWDACVIARNFTGFNADYYGGIIRAYYDGKMGWLNTVERGQDYAPGDIWGSVGAWFSGRWRTQPSLDYIGVVQQRLAERTWRQGYFAED